MKNMILTVTTVVTILIALVSCGKSDEAKNLRDELSDTKKATSDYVDRTLSKWKNDLSTLDDDIRELKDDAATKAGKLSDDAKEEFDAAITKLDVQRKALNAKLSEAKKSSGENWDKFESEFKSSWSDLKQSIDKLKKSMN